MQHTDGRLPAGVGILRRSDVCPEVSALLATQDVLLGRQEFPYKRPFFLVSVAMTFLQKMPPP